jgi:hypothetical protein
MKAVWRSGGQAVECIGSTPPAVPPYRRTALCTVAHHRERS